MFKMPNMTTNTAVDRALSILEAVAQSERGLTNSQISRQLDIPKSSASYLLRTLEQRGYLRKPGGQRYEIGLKVLGLGQSAMRGVSLRRASRAVLPRLVEETGLTAHVAILDHGRPVYIDRAEKPGFIKINTWVGRELPVHSTSVGKVLVADLAFEELTSILDRDGLERTTHKTITERSDFLAEIDRVREQGFAVDDEENNLGVRCIAVPIRDAAAQVVGALGVSGATSQFRSDRVESMVALARPYAEEISESLGAA